MVEVHNVGMKYQSLNGEITALENIDFSVQEGEFVSVVGPSGCTPVAKDHALELLQTYGLYEFRDKYFSCNILLRMRENLIKLDHLRKKISTNLHGKNFEISIYFWMSF